MFGVLANGEPQVQARGTGWKLRQLRGKVGLRSFLEPEFPN